MAGPRARNGDLVERIEQETRVEILPGTEVMADIGGAHFIHAHNSAHSTVLVPQPTDDPHDPLNWSAWWKLVVIINQGCFVVTSIIPALSIAPLDPIFEAQWSKTLTEIALLTGVCVILLGYFNFIIIPCSEIFGRRLTLLICALVNLAATIWQATANSYGSFLGARVLAGTGAAANESIMNVVVADVFFLHERGKYVGSYFWCYFGGLFLGPIISGGVASHVSYRWFFWACTISQGVNIISLIFLFPETRRMYKSKPTSVDTSVQPKSAIDEEKIDVTETQDIVASPASSDIVQDQWLGRGRPSRAQYNLIQPLDYDALKSVLRHFLTPVQLFFFPIVFWASMSMGAAANALLAVNLLQSQALAAPPYNWSPMDVGFANFALLVGGAVGLTVAGPWSDWVSDRATRRNGGIREPEMRLVSLVPFIAAALVGLVAFGVGVQDGWPWPAVVIVGFGLVGLQVVALPTITITYAIDCYKPVTGEIMVIATVCKNTFGFGMTYYMNNWAVKSGFIPPVMLLMAMTVGITLIGMVLLMFYGKTCRRWTKNSKVHAF